MVGKGQEGRLRPSDDRSWQENVFLCFQLQGRHGGSSCKGKHHSVNVYAVFSFSRKKVHRVLQIYRKSIICEELGPPSSAALPGSQSLTVLLPTPSCDQWANVRGR